MSRLEIRHGITFPLCALSYRHVPYARHGLSALAQLQGFSSPAGCSGDTGSVPSPSLVSGLPRPRTQTTLAHTHTGDRSHESRSARDERAPPTHPPTTAGSLNRPWALGRPEGAPPLACSSPYSLGSPLHGELVTQVITRPDGCGCRGSCTWCGCTEDMRCFELRAQRYSSTAFEKTPLAIIVSPSAALRVRYSCVR